MTLAPGTRLGPYEILTPIGAGGMGEVWKARDTRLGRIVAIKQVKEPHSERFKQEARSIAALNHPNICQLFDIGEDYLVLEYVEGKPLSCPLPEREAVRLAIQIATALEEAHAKGIIHRDLKPSNIMVTDKGSVKLLDIGLAKLYEQDASRSQSPTADFPATQAGAILGTVAYMSSEQAQGQPADARSDIFSFGLMLYEMLSGKKAFAGDSTPAVLAALLRDEPPPVPASQPLEKIVRRCLAKQPSTRYQTTSEVKAALAQLLAEKPSAAAVESQPSIAVLPFVNMSGDKEQEYFSDGLAEEIINALAKIPGLKIPARTSSFFFRSKECDVREIGSKLNVMHVLEGSVRKLGNRIRVTAQLINAADGYHLWSERYDREIEDVFAIQDEICQAIVENLRVKLSAGQSAPRRQTENLEAYNLFLKGRYYLSKFTPENFEKSKKYFEQAVSADPHYVMAWHGLAEFFFEMGVLGYMQTKEAFERSIHAIRKVLELDETMPEAHALMGALQSSRYDWKGAEREFNRALALDSRSEKGWAWLWIYYSIWYLLPLKRYEETLATLQKGIDLDPLSPFFQWLLAFFYYLTRQWDRALDQCRNVLEIDSNYYLAYQYLGFTYLERDMLDEGTRHCELAARAVGKSPWALVFPAIAYARTGRIEESKRLLGELKQLAAKTPVSPSAFSWIHCSLGEIDKALDWFERSVDDHDGLITISYAFPIYDPLRTHSRYHALLRKMNLEAKCP